MALIRYLLDTNVCIHLLRNNAPNVTARFAEVGATACGISEITLAELRVGAEISQRPAYQHELIDRLSASLSLFHITSAIRIFASERARLQLSGQIIDSFDLLIGATAIRQGLTLATNNTKDFIRLQGIVLEDWTKQLPA